MAAVLVELLTVVHRVCLHWLECLIVIIVDVHLLHLLHHLARVEALQASAAVSLLSRFVHKRDLRDLRLVLHAFVTGANSDTTHEAALRSTILRAVTRRGNVLVCNVEMTRGTPDTVSHVLWLLLLHVQLAQGQRGDFVVWLEKLCLVFGLKKLVDTRTLLIGVAHHVRGKLLLHGHSRKGGLIWRLDYSWSWN